MLRQVELPLALPLMFAGIRTAALFVICTTTIASLAGFSGQPRRHHRQRDELPLLGRARRGDLRRRARAGVEGVLALVQRALTPRRCARVEALRDAATN